MTEQPELMPGLPIDPRGLMAANLDDVPKDRWPRELVRAIEVMETAFVQAGHAEESAFELARAGVVALAEYGGGRQWYLPRGDALATALRDADIYRRSRRGNIADLAAEFGLTERHVWRIIRQQYALHRLKIQLQLPLGEEG
jgi:Mor family transcriptional regulator